MTAYACVRVTCMLQPVQQEMILLNPKCVQARRLTRACQRANWYVPGLFQQNMPMV